MPDGQTQIILKYEGQSADEAFDENGIIVPIPNRSDDSLSAFVEYGLTSRITIQGKLGWTRGSDLFGEYSGRGPVELGARYTFFKGQRTVLTAYGGAVLAGEGRNAETAPPGAGKLDTEVRLLAGRSGTLWRRHLFGEVQLARIGREGLPDETRIETTVGWEPRKHWLLLFQNYAGKADAEPVAPLWLKSEVSAVRDVGAWRLQAGWRSSDLGVDSPVSHGPVIALWRTF
ncbi:MAG TPA: hypothetical protein VF138_07750 [Caulobacteraceae bacterium]